MLGAPYASASVLMDNLALNTQSFAAYSSTTSVFTVLGNWLRGVATPYGTMDANSIIAAGILIDKWIFAKDLRGMSSQGLTVGGISNLNLNVEVMLASYVEDLKVLVPFYHKLVELTHQGQRQPTMAAVLV